MQNILYKYYVYLIEKIWLNLKSIQNLKKINLGICKIPKLTYNI